MPKVIRTRVGKDGKIETDRRVHYIVTYLQVGLYHIVTYHRRNFVGKSTP